GEYGIPVLSGCHSFFTQPPRPGRTSQSQMNRTRTDSSPGSINATPPICNEGARVAGPPAPDRLSTSAAARDANHARRHTAPGLLGSPARFLLSPQKKVTATFIREKRWLSPFFVCGQNSCFAALSAACTQGSGYTPITTTPAAQNRIAANSGTLSGTRPGASGASMYIRLASTR